MARILVLGGTGYAGANIVAEAAARGHEVVSVSRTLPAAPVDGVDYRSISVLEDGALDAAVAEADVVISAIAPRGELEGATRGVLATVASLAAAGGTRFGVIGGAGSLHVAEGGPRVIDTEGFPEAYKPEALEMTAVLDDLRASDEALDWFFVSPAGAFGGFNPGERLGRYRVGGDVLIVDDEGRSDISGADLAIAIVDELERPAHRRARFTVAY